jgi:hypothetical protein
MPRDPDPFPAIGPSELRLLMANAKSPGSDLLLIVDAQFEYEYRGGYIRGART